MPLTKKASKKYGRTIAGKLCKCIGKLKKAFGKTRTAKSKAIAICVSSVLQKKRGKTLKKFTCAGPKPMLITRKLRN